MFPTDNTGSNDMNWFKYSAAALGILITVLAASSHAEATVITPSERTSFNAGRTLLDASGGAASTTITTGVAADRVIDGQVQIDATSIQYWWKRRNGQSGGNAQREGANAWTFTLSHAGTTANLGGFPGAVTNHWFKTSAFDGVIASGDWVLTATSDYYKSAKRMVEFNLAGFFSSTAAPTTGSSGGSTSSGGQVPLPGTLLLILAGIGGIASARRKA